MWESEFFLSLSLSVVVCMTLFKSVSLQINTSPPAHTCVCMCVSLLWHHPTSALWIMKVNQEYVLHHLSVLSHTHLPFNQPANTQIGRSCKNTFTFYVKLWRMIVRIKAMPPNKKNTGARTHHACLIMMVTKTTRERTNDTHKKKEKQLFVTIKINYM